MKIKHEMIALALVALFAFWHMVIRNPNNLVISSTLPRPLAQCTPEELNPIATQLPGKHFITIASACPQATWLEEDSNDQKAHSSFRPKDLPIFREVPDYKIRKNQPLGIVIGCNKGYDAVSLLRRLSLNDTYSRKEWKKVLPTDGGACSQELVPEAELMDGHSSMVREATVYCIEAMPSNYEGVKKAASETLAWDSELKIIHAAFSDTEGTVLFPNGEFGVESSGVKDCELSTDLAKDCSKVRKLTLDAFMQEETHKKAISSSFSTLEIDYLSIDTEGNDFPVLMGAVKTLPHVKYLEFEYHEVGLWKMYTLESAIELLKEANFVCYFAGTAGYLWRITDCWIPHFNEWKQWSNIACVNSKRAPNLAAHMEDRFRSTISTKRDLFSGNEMRSDFLAYFQEEARKSYPKYFFG